MLRLNLSTRPFYNDRAVLGAIALVALVTAALTAFNIAQITSLNRRNREVVQQATAAESKAADLRAEAQKTRQAMNRAEVSEVQSAAREANLLIDRRVFSWTDLFNYFEETLPAEVRILAVSPQVDNQGRMLVAMTVISQRQEDRDAFIERLESTGAFSGVLSRTDNTEDDGTLRSIIQGYYLQPGREASAVSTAPSSDPGGAAGNTSPSNATPSNVSDRGPR